MLFSLTKALSMIGTQARFQGEPPGGMSSPPSSVPHQIRLAARFQIRRRAERHSGHVPRARLRNAPRPTPTGSGAGACAPSARYSGHRSAQSSRFDAGRPCWRPAPGPPPASPASAVLRSSRRTCACRAHRRQTPGSSPDTAAQQVEGIGIEMVVRMRAPQSRLPDSVTVISARDSQVTFTSFIKPAQRARHGIGAGTRSPCSPARAQALCHGAAPAGS